MRFAFFLGCVVVLAGCGGDVFNDGDGGGDAAIDSPVSDSPVDSPIKTDAGPFVCGTTTCGGDQICIHPCCGGANICDPLDDGGTCPFGTQMSQTCPPTAPCTYVCVPPAPYCGTTKDCSMVQGHDCYLVCQ